MTSQYLVEKSTKYMHKLCAEIKDRSVGSEGNRQATRFLQETLTSLGWNTEAREFKAMDWTTGGASLEVGGQSFEVSSSPYSNGCDVTAELVGASTLQELESTDIHNRVLLLHGELAKEQLAPKNFVWFNPEEHQKIIALLEKGSPAVLLCATGRNAALAGGVYPFPLIEDGDFNLPSVFMTEEEGQKLLPLLGKTARVVSSAERIPSRGFNITAWKGNPQKPRVVVSAHVDAKKGSPGAIDNATGVTVLLLLAELLKDYAGETLVEIAAFNGEDYYAAPGQMLYLEQMQARINEVLLDINIDGAGYRDGNSAFSFYGLPDEIRKTADEIIQASEGIEEGPQWYQGDHSIFIQQGRPAIAVTSKWFNENMDDQEITHTPKDNLGIVDFSKPVVIAEALAELIRKIDQI